jgi:hypothetical protein
MKLFITGFIQVLFVVINTYFIAQRYFIGVAICSFVISLIWSFNVKKVAFGTLNDRLIYSFGACVGSILGLFLSVYLLKWN